MLHVHTSEISEKLQCFKMKKVIIPFIKKLYDFNIKLLSLYFIKSNRIL